MALDSSTALQLARDAYSASTSYFDSSIRKEIEADLRRFQNLHPVGSKYLSDAYRAKSRIFRPKVRTMVTKHEAIAAEAFFANRDVVALEPQDDNDPVQKGSAALHKELLQFRLTKTIPWFLTVMGAYQDSLNVGLVCSYQHWVFNPKKGKDEPGVRLIPLENVRFDPGASWLNPVATSPYFIEMIPMYVKDVKDRMRQADAKTGETKWKPLDDGAILAAMKGYSDSVRLQREQGRQDSKENVTAVTNYAIVWVHKNIVEHDGEDYCYYTLSDQQLLSDPVPLKERYHHGERPYVIGYSSIEAHKNYPAGANRKSKDLVAEINEIANARIENLKLALNKRYLVGRNRQVDIRSLTRNVAGSATLVNDTEKDVKALEFSDVTAGSFKEQEVLSLEFDEATGNFASASVQANRSTNETAKGMELVKDDANIVSGYQLRTFAETWMEPVLRQLVKLEQAYETDEVILAIAGQKAKLDELGFDAITDELIEQDLILSVNVGFGPTSPTEKLNRFLTAMRALKEMLMDGVLTGYGLKFDEVCQEVFGALGYKDGSRFFDLDTQDPRIAQLQAEMEKLQQQLDAKQPPQLIDAQVRLIDAQIAALEPKNKLATAQAINAGVDTTFKAMQAAEVVAAIPLAAPVADAIMQGAGYQHPNPPGVDPNIPTAGTPTSTAAAVAPQGGVGTVQQDEVTGGAPGDTSPNTPAHAGGAGGTMVKPGSPGDGADKGIETERSDSGPGFADGGLVAYEDEFGKVGVSTKKGLKSGSVIDRELSALGTPGARGMRDMAQGAVDARDSNAFERERQRQSAVGTARSAVDSAGGGGAIVPPAYAGFNVSAPPPAPAPTSIAQVGQSSIAGPLGSGRYGLDDTGYADGGVVGEDDKAKPAPTPAPTPAPANPGTQLAFPGSVKVYPDDIQNAVPAKTYADGGQIVGPGTGTSDSIPAVTEQGDPLKVSNGEYTIPPAVVQAMGKDFFDKLIAQYHTPVKGQAPIYQAKGPMDSPLGVQTGTVIIPADVVQALGKDFFDQLVQQYGGAQ